MTRLNGPVRELSPCYGCKRPQKTSGCHGSCQEFKDWKGTVDQVNKARKDYEAKPPVVYTNLNFGKRKEIL